MLYKEQRPQPPPHPPPGAAVVRLVNGPTSCSGRVEVFHRDTWGTVCDDGWTLRNTEVVCNSLDCGTALEINPSAFYGQGKGMIWLDDVRCSGQETSLQKCKHSALSIHNCGHGEDVGVVCSGSAAVQQRVFTLVFHISPVVLTLHTTDLFFLREVNVTRPMCLNVSSVRLGCYVRYVAAIQIRPTLARCHSSWTVV